MDKEQGITALLIGLMRAYVRVQNFTIKLCFCKIIFQRERTFIYFTWELF